MKSDRSLIVAGAGLISVAILIAVCSFAQSFRVLAELGEAYHLSPAWSFPLSIDGVIVMSMIGAYCSMRAKAHVWPYVALIVLFTALSIVLNVANGHEAAMSSTWLGVLVHAVPPSSLAIALKILMHMVNIWHLMTDKKVAAATRKMSSAEKTKKAILDKVAELHKMGKTVTEIAQIVRRNEKTVRRYLTEIKAS
jgi:hypothetical protein